MLGFNYIIVTDYLLQNLYSGTTLDFLMLIVWLCYVDIELTLNYCIRI